MGFRIYHYWRSSSSWRVRWALALKKITYEAVPINLLNDDTLSPEYLAKNPAGTVPTLEVIQADGSSHFILESLAICEYLEEGFPSPPLYPSNSIMRAQARAFAEYVNSGIHPLQNLSTLELLQDKLDENQRRAFARVAIEKGLTTLEALANEQPGPYCYGEHLTIADLCLVPQLYNARRFEVDLKQFPRLLAIESNALQHESAQASHPTRFEPAAPSKK